MRLMEKYGISLKLKGHLAELGRDLLGTYGATTGVAAAILLWSQMPAELRELAVRCTRAINDAEPNAVAEYQKALAALDGEIAGLAERLYGKPGSGKGIGKSGSARTRKGRKERE